MFELAGDFRFAEEPLADGVVFGMGRLQFLDGDFAIQLGIDRPHHLPDAAAGEQSQDAKPAAGRFAALLRRWRRRGLVQQLVELELPLKLRSASAESGRKTPRAAAARRARAGRHTRRRSSPAPARRRSSGCRARYSSARAGFAFADAPLQVVAGLPQCGLGGGVGRFGEGA